jgi:hypothetical protein
VIDRTVQQVLDAQPALSDLSSWTAISGWFDDLVEIQNARHAVGGCPIGGLAGQLAETDEQSRHALAQGFDRWQEPLYSGLEKMRSRGSSVPTPTRRGSRPPRSPRSKAGSFSRRPDATQISSASRSTPPTHTCAHLRPKATGPGCPTR